MMTHRRQVEQRHGRDGEKLLPAAGSRRRARPAHTATQPVRFQANSRSGVTGAHDGNSGALQPDELATLRAGVGHPQIADEGHEPAVSLARACRTDGGRIRLDRRDAQRPSRRWTRNGHRPVVVACHAGLSVAASVPQEQAVVEIGSSRRIVRESVRQGSHFCARMVAQREAPRQQMGVAWLLTPCYSGLTF